MTRVACFWFFNVLAAAGNSVDSSVARGSLAAIAVCKAFKTITQKWNNECTILVSQLDYMEPGAMLVPFSSITLEEIYKTGFCCYKFMCFMPLGGSLLFVSFCGWRAPSEMARCPHVTNKYKSICSSTFQTWLSTIVQGKVPVLHMTTRNACEQISVSRHIRKCMSHDQRG